MARSLALYQDRHVGATPRQLVIHKHTPFTPDELACCSDAWGATTELACVTLERPSWRGVQLTGKGKPGYAVERGTVLPLDGHSALVWIGGNAPEATLTGRGNFVMGRGGTAYIEVVPRAGNPNGARVKMMRPRRIYVSADLERLFADYLTHLACRAAGLGMTVSPGSPLLVNLDRPPLLAAIREGTVRDKVTALKKKGIGPAGWTPHWFRHIACLGLAAGRGARARGDAQAGARRHPDHDQPIWLGQR